MKVIQKKKNVQEEKIWKNSITTMFCTSFANVKRSRDVFQHMKIIFRFPFRRTTFSNGMVIDFLMFTSRPSPMEWSLIFLCLYQGLLQWNGHWFSYVYIKALSNGMVIDLLMFNIKALSNRMIIDFLMFTSRSSLMEWSLIFFLYNKTLFNGMVSDFFLPF